MKVRFETPEEFAAFIERMVPLFVDKAKMHHLDPSYEEWWESVVGTLIADTVLCLTVDDFLERWEKE